VHLVLALGPEDEQGRPEVGISEGPAENDHASFDKAVDEGRVLVPTGLLASRPRVIPTRAGEFSNEEVIQPTPPR
jgi:hypothetical protein